MQVTGVESRPGRPIVAKMPSVRPQLAYRVGGISVGLCAREKIRLKLDRELEPFSIEADQVDVPVEVEWADHLAMPRNAAIFQSGGLWSLYGADGGYEFYFSTPFLGAAPYKSAWFDTEFRRGRIRLHRRYYNSDRAVNPLEYPLDELLAIHRLSRGEGIEVHAVGVVDELGRGYLFLGHSGAGKSTSARLWQKRPGVRVLSDDRIILRPSQGHTRMFGTPWHGDAGLALADSADLSAMYLLAHGTSNELTPLPAGRAAAELLARSFVPHHSAEGLRSSLQMLEHITGSVPCSHFQFVPDQTAVETICHD